MKGLTIEQKARKYDEAIEIARKEYKNHESFKGFCEMLVHIFPELKESEGERMRKKCIELIKELKSFCMRDGQEECITWLEKQGEHKKFRDSIQVGDKVTRNEDGVLVNLSQLNRVAKKDEKQGKQKPAWSEEDEENRKNILYILNQLKGTAIYKEDNSNTCKRCALVDICPFGLMPCKDASGNVNRRFEKVKE